LCRGISGVTKNKGEKGEKMLPEKQLKRAKEMLEKVLKTLKEGNPRNHPYEEKLESNIEKLNWLILQYKEEY